MLTSEEITVTKWNRTSRDCTNGIVVDYPENPKRSIAKPHRLFEHCVKYRRQIAGGGIDGLQHLSSCGLLLQRLARLGQQPRVLHRDHRLCREVFDQCDFF